MTEKFTMTTINNWIWPKNIFTIYFFTTTHLNVEFDQTMSTTNIKLVYFSVMFNMLMFVVVNFFSHLHQILVIFIWSYSFGHVSIPRFFCRCKNAKSAIISILFYIKMISRPTNKTNNFNYDFVFMSPVSLVLHNIVTWDWSQR